MVTWLRPQPYLLPLHNTQQQQDINKETNNVVERESDVSSITDTIQPSVTSNQDSRSVSFYEQEESQQLPIRKIQCLLSNSI